MGCRDKAAARCRDGSAKPGVTPGGVPGGLGLPAPHPPRSLRSAVPWGASGAPSAAAHVAVCFLDGPRESPRGPAMGHAARPPPPPPFRSPAHCFGDMSLPSTPLTGIPVLPEGRRGEREWGGSASPAWAGWLSGRPLSLSPPPLVFVPFLPFSLSSALGSPVHNRRAGGCRPDAVVCRWLRWRRWWRWWRQGGRVVVSFFLLSFETKRVATVGEGVATVDSRGSTQGGAKGEGGGGGGGRERARALAGDRPPARPPARLPAGLTD